MTEEKNLIENLVFEGGGVRGIAYAGAVEALDSRGLLAGVRGVAGSSAGAFMALLLSLKNSPDEIAEALNPKHFKSLEDKPNPIRVATHYGLYKGEVLYDWIVAQLTQKGLSPDLTFEGLQDEGARDLRVFATDLTLCNTRQFSVEKTPKASVVGAVRASMSIPLLYSAWQFPNSIPDNHIYVDGGVVYNYPINAFDDGRGFNPRTLGFHFIKSLDTEPFAEVGLNNLFEFANRLFATALRAQVIDLDQDIEESQQTVGIDDLGFKATDFDISDDGFERLYRSGYDATIKHLKVA